MIKIIVEQDEPIFGDIRQGFAKHCEFDSHWEGTFDDLLDMFREAARLDGFEWVNGDSFIKYGMELNDEYDTDSRYIVDYANVDNE